MYLSLSFKPPVRIRLSPACLLPCLPAYLPWNSIVPLCDRPLSAHHHSVHCRILVSFCFSLFLFCSSSPVFRLALCLPLPLFSATTSASPRPLHIPIAPISIRSAFNSNLSAQDDCGLTPTPPHSLYDHKLITNKDAMRPQPLLCFALHVTLAGLTVAQSSRAATTTTAAATPPTATPPVCIPQFDCSSSPKVRSLLAASCAPVAWCRP